MTALQFVKGASVLISLALASLLRENLIPTDYIPYIGWLSGALIALPAHVDRLFGFVSVHRNTIRPPPMPTGAFPSKPPYDSENL
jgi:hypothetical protein